MLSKRAALAERLGSIGSWQKGLVSKRKNKGFFIFFIKKKKKMVIEILFQHKNGEKRI